MWAIAGRFWAGCQMQAARLVLLARPTDWGLRDYNIPPVVWGGEIACEHVWGEEATTPSFEQGNKRNPTDKTKEGTKGTPRTVPPSGRHCSLCGAWLGCLGLEPDPTMFCEHMVEVFRGVWRVLRDDGVLWLNLGDSYNGSGGAGGDYAAGGLKDGQPRFPGRNCSGLKPKDLVGIPWRVAFALQADGWYLRSAVVWAKGVSFCPTYAGSVMPESCTDRPTSAYEMVFLFTKSGSPTYWTHRDRAGTRLAPRPDYRWQLADGQEQSTEPGGDWRAERVSCPDCGGTGYVSPEIATELFGSFTSGVKVECERCKALECSDCGLIGTGDACEECGGRMVKSKRRTVRAWVRANLWKGHDYFYDAESVREMALQPRGQAETAGRQHKQVMLGREGGTLGTNYGSAGRNLRNVWVLNPKPTKEAHFATFPPSLVTPCVRAGSSARGCCSACSAPWERVVEKAAETQGRGRDHIAGGDTTIEHGWEGTPRATLSTTTTGWRPTCDCPAAEPVPCTVFDPFSGSATSGLVAIQEGRHYIGIDASEEYTRDIAIPRLESVSTGIPAAERAAGQLSLLEQP